VVVPVGTVVAVVVPSNDLFYAPGGGGIDLFDGRDPVSGDVTDQVGLWDAGTEPNQRPGFGADQAPAQSSPDQGADEGGVVRPIGEVDDGYSYPSVADSIRVTLTPSPAHRQLSRTAVPGGGTIDATVTFEQAHDKVAIFDQFEGPVAASSVEEVRVDGAVLPDGDVSVDISRATASGLLVAVDDVEASMTVELDYSVRVEDGVAPGSTVDFVGSPGADVSADVVIDAELGTDTATVSTGGAVARADLNGDGDISTTELSVAVSDWSQGRYTTRELGPIVNAWASS